MNCSSRILHPSKLNEFNSRINGRKSIMKCISCKDISKSNININNYIILFKKRYLPP